MRLAPDGKIIWGPAAVISLICLLVAALLRSSLALWIGIVGSIPFVLSAFFFRDPERLPPTEPGIVVAPADGKIIEIRDLKGEKETSAIRRKISIFMSPLNVHVNRIPAAGIVEKLSYSPGKCLKAFHVKASALNEQQFIRIRTAEGLVDCVQIAGWLARRIVCHLKVGQAVQTGERFGLIRFGSRLDIYLPENCRVSIRLQQQVRAGETVIGEFYEKI